MELLSIVPLASNSCPHTLIMTRKRKSVLPSMNMSLTTVVSGDGVQRRTDGNYQPVLWNDDIIQLLSTPYGEPAYRDRADRLVGEVKEIFNSLTLTPLSDLLQRLSMVDSIERLGIDRHFKNEIKSALTYVYRNTEKLLELAKLEFNIFQSIQKKELESLFRWWKDSGTSHITFTRHRHVEYYTMASCISSLYWMIWNTTLWLLVYHHCTGTVDELELFTEAIKRWNPSATDCLPEYMKGVYMMVYDTLNEMSREADKAQGRDTLTYVRHAWGDCIDSFMQEAKWIATGELPSFEEYYENGKVSSAHRISALQPILTTNISFSHHILKEVDFPSKLNDLASVVLRLRGDMRCYKADRARGEEASSISCYMKDNPGSTEEDALNHINAMISDVIKGLNWELLKPDSNVPIGAKKHVFDISRAFHYGYKYRDSYRCPNLETKSLVMKTLLEPVPM